MARASRTIKQPLGYQSAHAAWFAATKDLFNQVAAFYFAVIATHPGVLDLLYGTQESSGHAAYTLKVDYPGVQEEAVRL